jgi:acyl-CoA synthetase (AMP-forming)/AMP-acid ligase II/acyl carrier protein
VPRRHSFSCLEELLSYHGRKSPNRNAILASGRVPVTYGLLRARAKDVVHGLRSIGVGRGDRVAVVLPGGPDAAIAMITVAAGAVCVPLNPGFTTDECQRYFGELRLAALLTHPEFDSPGRRVAGMLGVPVIDLAARPIEGAGASAIAGRPSKHVADADFASGTDDAFILLTSGSTSRPKTVPLTHASVCLSAQNVGAALELGPRDRLLSVLPLFHGHGLISGLVAALAAGSSVVSTPGFDAAAFFGWLTEFRPTWYTAVPAIHRALLSAPDAHKRTPRRSSLRLIRSASSTLPPELLDGLEARFDVPVIDTYGMTESATQIASNPLQRRKRGSVGRQAGPEIAILDTAGRRLRFGRTGEIALRGPTITRGYDNDADATASAFRNGWFRTGDLGYLDEDGYLFIVGRIKEVIHRGAQKVAPAEVEAALLSHPDVAEAAVFAVPHKNLGADVAAVVVLRPDAKVNPQQLRDFARERLARFKVPGLIKIVPEITKGAGGKIKRGDLAAAFLTSEPRAQENSGRERASPRSELERQLAGMYADLLGIDHVGADQDVVALGVDSLTMMQVISRLRERFDVDISFKDIFEAPTVMALAARLERSKKGAAAASTESSDSPTDVPRVEGDGSRPASIVQERMLRIERGLPGLLQLNQPFAYRLRGPLDLRALKRSLSEVVRRHESLRTGFGWQDEQPVALVKPAVAVKSVLRVEDLSAGASSVNARVKALLLKKAELRAEQESLRPIDMNRAPVFRAHLFRLDDRDHILLLVLHDIIVDGWSIGVLSDELSALYAAFIDGTKVQPPEPALQFSDFAAWQRRWSTSDAAGRQLAYWKASLQNASALFDTTKSDRGDERAGCIAQEEFQISNDLVTHLRALSRSFGATLFITLLAGFKTLLMHRSGRGDICVATMMANRPSLKTERVIGPFANTSLIRTKIDADATFKEALDRVREVVLEAYTAQELPFDIIADRLVQEDGLDAASLAQFYFALQVAFRRPLKLTNLTIQSFAYQRARSVMPIERSWLSLTLRETETGIIGACRFKNEMFDQNTVQDWISDYTSILEKAVANPNMPLGQLADR